MTGDKVIRIDDEVWQGLKELAEPLEDTSNSVIRRLLGIDAQKGSLEIDDSDGGEIPKGTEELLKLGPKRNIGGALRRIRESRGLSLSNVSKRTDIGVSYLSMLENNKRRLNLETLNKLAVYYKYELALVPMQAKEKQPSVEKKAPAKKPGPNRAEIKLLEAISGKINYTMDDPKA